MQVHLKFIFLFFFFLTWSCKKDTAVLGTEVQPGYDLLNAKVTEIIPVSMYSQKIDSIISFNGDYKYLGSNQDPAFGRTDVGLYLNASLNLSNGNFGDSAAITSSEIILEVFGTEYMGEASTPLSYSVFPIDSSLNINRFYYSSSYTPYAKDSIIASYTGIYSLLDGRVVLRIPVDTAYARFMLKNPQYLTGNAAFQAKYKGYYISCAKSNLNPQSSPGIISIFNLTSGSVSGLYLRYKRTPSSLEESERLTFAGETAVRYNTINYQPNQGGSYLLTDQLNGDTLKGNQNAFLKGLAGTNIKVNIPGLKYYPDSQYVSVNRAEVIFHIDNAFNPTLGKYNPPPILSLIPLDSLGRESFGGHTYNVNNLSLYDGHYNATNQQYTFNIARYIQLVMNGSRKNWGFSLIVADPDPSHVFFRDVYMNRVVFYGLNNIDLKPRCNLYYVRLKEK